MTLRRRLVIAAVGAVAAAPVVAALAGSLQSPGDGTFTGLGWVVRPPTLDAFRAALTTVPLTRWLLTTALVCAVAVPVATLTASWAGAAAVLGDHTTRRLVVAASAAAMLVPPSALWVPRVVAATRLGLAGNPMVLAAPALAATTPILVLLCASATARIPSSVLDAARVEGAGALRIWWRVVVPLTGRTLTAVAVLALVAHWGDLVEPLLLLGDQERLTVAVGLTQLRTTEVPQYPIVLAACVLAAAPPLVLFALGQRALLGARR